MGVEYEVPYYQANPDGLWKYVGVGINYLSEKMVEPTRHGGIMGRSWEYHADIWQAKMKFRVLTNTTGVEPLNQPGVNLCF